VSERVFSVVRQVVGPLEQVALDEAFTEPAVLSGADEVAVEEFATGLRDRVRRDTGLAASVGAGSGKQIAKIASGLAKPDGLRIVSQGREREVLAPLPSWWALLEAACCELDRAAAAASDAITESTVPACAAGHVPPEDPCDRSTWASVPRDHTGVRFAPSPDGAGGTRWCDGPMRVLFSSTSGLGHVQPMLPLV